MACLKCYDGKATSGTSIYLDSPKNCCLRSKVLTVRRLPGRLVTRSNGVGEKIISYREVDASTVRIEVLEANEREVWKALHDCPNVTSIEDGEWTTTVSGRHLPQDGIPMRKTQEIQTSAVNFGVVVVVISAAALAAMVVCWRMYG